jgi:fructoselysine-6-P-deglycase FrlB-like protein
MTFIENEIMTQHEALLQTSTWFDRHRSEVSGFLRSQPWRQLVFLGSGSSYILACTGATLFALRTPMKATAISGGDFMLQPETYQACLQGALVVVLTRSGQTTEIERSIELIRSLSDAGVLCLHTRSGSVVPARSDFEVAMDWAYDQSVCQTRTGGNFYLALLELLAVYTDDASLPDQILQAVRDNQVFKQKYRQVLTEAAGRFWSRAVILADAELAGLARVGALAFTEICLKPSEAYNLLDYRHGPAVLAGHDTLVIAVLRGKRLTDQKRLMSDLHEKGAYLVALASSDIAEADLTVIIPDYTDPAVWGIPMVFLAQIMSFAKAIAEGHDPDHPQGLEPYIILP